ncbi:hypothetical protein [Bacteroides sp. GM023]|uniref:hypothetical protein n=1 Tax=Bacteroides sp. GM023 TaxID=2723058 RepID=UPI00168AF856|nr:hypothetical protein [Bacteroides sp. GM023]MBD3590062.1 hypothetical protein [Bacteroides sp. GM023]
MKLLKYKLGVLLCLTTIFFIACDSDDESIQQNPKPTIKFTKVGNEPVIAYPGTELSFSVEMAATAGIKRVVTVLDSQEIPGSAKEYPENTEKDSYSVSYTIKSEEVGKTLNFVILAYDNEEKKSTAEYAVYIQAAKPEIDTKIPDTAPETVTAGEVIAFDIEITSTAALRSIKTYLGDVEITELSKEIFENPNSDTYAFSYTTTDLDAGQTLSFAFEVMDANGGIVRTGYSVEVTRAVELDINEFYGLQIGAQTSTDAGPFLNTTNGEIYVRDGAAAKSADIDITLFYSNGSYGYYFVSPSDASIEAIFKAPDAITTWEHRNSTKLKVIQITPDEFLAINSTEMIQNLYTNSSGAEVEKLTDKLGVGSIIGFKTVADKYGIMIVKSFASGSAKGNVTIDMKVEK